MSILTNLLNKLIEVAYGPPPGQQQILALPAGSSDFDSFDDEAEPQPYLIPQPYTYIPAQIAPPVATVEGLDKVEKYPPNVWIPNLLDDMEHLLVTGRTKAGKTVLMRALYRAVQERGHLIYLLSPKAQYKYDCAAAGYGSDYDAIRDAMGHFLDVLKKRSRDFARDKDDWQHLYIFCDEYGAIAENLPELATRFLRRIGSEGREMKIHLVVFNQSPNCTDLGISAKLRDNFSRVFLARQARDVLPEAFNQHDKRPAVLDFEGQLYAIGCEGLLNYHNQPLQPGLFYGDMPNQDTEYLGYYQQSQSQPNPTTTYQNSSTTYNPLIELVDFSEIANLVTTTMVSYQPQPATFDESLSLAEKALVGYQAGYTSSRRLGQYLNINHVKANLLIEQLKSAGQV